MRTLFLCVLLLSAVTTSSAAFADECVLPVCNLQEQLDEFKAMKETRRFSFLEQMGGDYRENTEVDVAKNIIEFTRAAVDAENSGEKSARVLRQAALLLDQSYEQVARFDSLSNDTLVGSYRQLTQSTSRFRVISHWVNKLADIKELVNAQKLRHFFVIAREVAVAAGDEEYITREAFRGEQSANRRMIELSPTDGPAFQLPVVDMDKALNGFRALGIAERFVLVKSLTERFGTSNDASALMSLVEFSQGVAEILKGTDETQAMIVRQNATLFSQTVELLSHNVDLTSDEMVTYFKLLVGGATSRYGVIQYWSAKISESTNVEFLYKLSRFFIGARAACEAVKDDPYISREAFLGEQRAYRRLIEVQKTPNIVVPIANVASAADAFRGMSIPERYLVIKKLATDFESSTDSKSLITILAYAKSVREVAAAAGETQTFIRDEADLLIAQTIGLLVRSQELSADGLVTYFKELTTAVGRLQVIQYWGAQVDVASTKPELQKLIRFFMLARKVSNAAEDDDYIPREAQRNEQRARKKLAEIGA